MLQIATPVANVPQRQKVTDNSHVADGGAGPAAKKVKGQKIAAAAPAGSKYGPKVQKLQRICRSAGIPVPPAMYKKVNRHTAYLLADNSAHLDPSEAPADVDKHPEAAAAACTTCTQLLCIDLSHSGTLVILLVSIS